MRSSWLSCLALASESVRPMFSHLSFCPLGTLARVFALSLFSGGLLFNLLLVTVIRIIKTLEQMSASSYITRHHLSYHLPPQQSPPAERPPPPRPFALTSSVSGLYLDGLCFCRSSWLALRGFTCCLYQILHRRDLTYAMAPDTRNGQRLLGLHSRACLPCSLPFSHSRLFSRDHIRVRVQLIGHF